MFSLFSTHLQSTILWFIVVKLQQQQFVLILAVSSAHTLNNFLDNHGYKVCATSFSQTLSHCCQLKLSKCQSAGGAGPSFRHDSVKSIFIFLLSVDGANKQNTELLAADY